MSELGREQVTVRLNRAMVEGGIGGPSHRAGIAQMLAPTVAAMLDEAVREWRDAATRFSDDYHAELNRRIDAESARAEVVRDVEAVASEWDGIDREIGAILGHPPQGEVRAHAARLRATLARHTPAAAAGAPPEPRAASGGAGGLGEADEAARRARKAVADAMCVDPERNWAARGEEDE